ncbi:MAG TPA: hypothetical protein DEO56_00880 [Nitrosomonas nitrosa]|uniref:class III lanthionine synthetase LanKC n=1 Tax=Nitrosomonas sp. TaxID=42353 RepID=UPI000ED644E9|nr:class III lanthionine synthetase LanKC [Nitrosomonas sp.]GJL76348.1 MAG: serine/threonine protein kinase [Nitrosomonas sp.]HBZ29147.1 hypothetical protein [Nitrosomonas nitrosa]HNP52027.1 class III lanthionine synthetase LanKC [Nitrosomonas nitrosa]
MHTLEAIEFYTQYHPRWFESVQRYSPSNEYIDIYLKIIPDHWDLSRTGLWYSVNPPDVALTDQGWKLHISVSTIASTAALQKLLPLLRDESVPFKFLLDPSITSLTNGKLWPRESSGKFVTIYPTCLNQFYRLGNRLSEELASFVGPYILSDRRWPGSKSVYYRYGGFAARSLLQVNGARVYTILSPEGVSVPDERTPYWNPPPWVSDPFPESGKTVHAGTGLDNGRFTIISALSFSNRGGVYKGIDKQSGLEVVIKEARPNVELGSNRLEAIAILQKEYRLLESLSSTGYFVQPVTFFTAWEHAFLVEKYEPGELIGQYTIRHNPLYAGKITAVTLDAYFEQMRLLWIQLVKAIASAHERGIVLSDLSFTNILVNEGRICIFDLETSVEQGVDDTVGLYTPGMATTGISDQANDYYALGAIVFGSIFLAHGMVGLYPPSLHRFLEELVDDIDLPEKVTILIRNLIESPEQYVASPQSLIKTIKQLSFNKNSASARMPRLALPVEQRFKENRRDRIRRRAKQAVDGVVRYLNRTANTARNDRLFPADLLVFETNPLSVAYGATGVIYALHRIGGKVHQPLVDWVLQRSVNLDGYPPGLFLGQAGIAWVLSELGYIELAVKIMHAVRHHQNLNDSANVLHGAAGYGLACLKLWNKGAGSNFLDEAARIGKHLRNTSVLNQHGIYWPGKKGGVTLGYAYGGSGIALFLLYLSLATRDQRTLELGRMALDFELQQGVWLDGEFSGFPESIADPLETVIEPTVSSCYWEVGSAGVGTALARFAAVTSDKELLSWLDHLAADASRKYTAFPQLFRGLAGLGNFLLDVWYQTGDERHLLAAWEAAEGVLLFRIDCEEGVAFPGEQTRRESADLATGGAGVALFLDRLLKTQDGIQENFLFVVDELLSSGDSKVNHPGFTGDPIS